MRALVSLAILFAGCSAGGPNASSDCLCAADASVDAHDAETSMVASDSATSESASDAPDSSAECCPISDTPACCMDFGGVKPEGGSCGKTCDHIPTMMSKKVDAFGCLAWVAEPGSPTTCDPGPLDAATD